VDNEPEVAYAELLTLSIELLSAEPVTSKAKTLVLNDPLAADSEPDVADSEPEVADSDPDAVDNEPEVAYAELLTVYNEPEVSLYAPVVAKAVLFKPSNVSALAAYDADKAFDPEITPVVVIAPDELIDISVVEPLTKVMLPLLYWIMLVRFDAD
jgi:hypothetical protein